MLGLSRIKKSLTEDWTLPPLLMCIVTGFAVALLDFIFLQNLTFQIYAIVGIGLLLIGGYLRYKIRYELKNRAGFSSIASTGRLQITESHQLITDGYYKYIRHPLYLAETLRNFSFILIFSSLYGALFMVVGTIFLLLRIRTEEKMLIDAFGKDYIEYQKKTKKIIPYIY